MLGDLFVQIVDTLLFRFGYRLRVRRYEVAGTVHQSFKRAADPLASGFLILMSRLE